MTFITLSQIGFTTGHSIKNMFVHVSFRGSITKGTVRGVFSFNFIQKIIQTYRSIHMKYLEIKRANTCTYGAFKIIHMGFSSN